MRGKLIKMKIMNKNKQHIGLKMSSIKTRTAHSRDRRQFEKNNIASIERCLIFEK